VKLGVAAAVVALLAPSARTVGPAYLPLDTVLRRLDRASLVVRSRPIPVRSATTLCAGSGRPVRRNGTRMWHRFACTFTTFTRAGVDRDIDFVVYVRSRTRLAIASAHWVEPTP
jgi:hypothetical protein